MGILKGNEKKFALFLQTFQSLKCSKIFSVFGGAKIHPCVCGVKGAREKRKHIGCDGEEEERGKSLLSLTRTQLQHPSSQDQ
jgi:hypothetical protein